MQVKVRLERGEKFLPNSLFLSLCIYSTFVNVLITRRHSPFQWTWWSHPSFSQRLEELSLQESQLWSETADIRGWSWGGCMYSYVLVARYFDRGKEGDLSTSVSFLLIQGIKLRFGIECWFSLEVKVIWGRDGRSCELFEPGVQGSMYSPLNQHAKWNAIFVSKSPIHNT